MNLGEFYTAHSHVNEVTGCVIWDGETSKGIPIVAGPVNIQVRRFVFESLNGAQPYRDFVHALLRKLLCVKVEHINAVVPEKKPPQLPT